MTLSSRLEKNVVLGKRMRSILFPQLRKKYSVAILFLSSTTTFFPYHFVYYYEIVKNIQINIEKNIDKCV